MPAERFTGWGWPGLGLVGSIMATVAGPDLFGGHWWFRAHVPGGHVGAQVLFYAGLAALCLAWLGLGRQLGTPAGLAPSRLVLVGAVWCLPLAVGTPLFSHDAYSYLAQGEILHLGLSPYHQAPAVLAHHGQEHFLAAVSPFWRHTTSPYGPLFLGLASLIVSVVGSHLVAGVLLMRGLDLAGVALLAVFVPRLARALGADAARATWLAVISPLVLLELVAAVHNDALMVGLLVAGVTLAVERRPLPAIALCALAATIKLPALAAVAFIAVAWARGERRPARALGLSAAAAISVLAAVSAATTLGAGWVSTGVLSTPGKVHLAITPTTATGWSAGSLLHLLGVHVSTRGIESALGAIALALTVVLGVWLLARARQATFVPALGALLLVSVFAGPATWPWYLTWGLALLACGGAAQRSRALPLAIVLAVFLVKPDGILVLPLQSSPFVLAVYAALAGAAWHLRRGQVTDRPSRRWHRMAAAEQPALTNL